MKPCKSFQIAVNVAALQRFAYNYIAGVVEFSDSKGRGGRGMLGSMNIMGTTFENT